MHARFTLLGLVEGDRLELAAPGEQARTYRLIQAATDEVLHFEGDAEPGLYDVRVLRAIEEPCPVCEKAGTPAEQDHLHCNSCKARVEMGKGVVNCEACIAKMRQRLKQGGLITTEVSLYGGRKIVKLHSRSVAEADQLQEYQDKMILGNPNQTTHYVLDETRRAAVALTLDDDGNGKSPRAAIAPDSKLTPSDQIIVMVKHFKGMTAAYYNALLSAVAMFDTLVEDACKGEPDDSISDDDLLLLAEGLAIGPTPVLGQVKCWGGELMLTFAAPSTDDIDAANAFAENFIQASKAHILDGRAKFIIALSRLAAHFRGDAAHTFGEEASFDDRLDYLLNLPIAMYYVYQDAAIVWQRRMAKASQVEVLGNF